MRLRQLGTTQSIVWISPPEVHQGIIDLAQKTARKTEPDTIDSHDVICWLIEQTCSEIEQLQPLRYSQGQDFVKRIQAALTYHRFVSDDEHATEYANSIQQREQYELEYLYGLKCASKGAKAILEFTNPTLVAYIEDLVDLKAKFEDTGDAVEAVAHQVVEQEREVAHEVELVQQLERPIHASALAHRPLDEDLETFAQFGRLPANSRAYEVAAVALRQTALGRRFKIKMNCFSSRLYVSTDFAKTILLTQDEPSDNYQRPVNWILVCPKTETFIIISPHEAGLLVPLLRQSHPPQTHLAVYAASVARSMLPLRGLIFYSIPSLPKGWMAPENVVLDLAIFAGGLYMSFEECEAISEYLTQSSSGPGVMKREPPFGERSMTFMQEWLAVRRKGQEYTHTPLGYIVQSRKLVRDHPFFRRPLEQSIVGVLEEEVDARGSGVIADEALEDEDGINV